MSFTLCCFMLSVTLLLAVCNGLSGNDCNRVDNAVLAEHQGNYAELFIYTASIPIGVCIETYFLPLEPLNATYDDFTSATSSNDNKHRSAYIIDGTSQINGKSYLWEFDINSNDNYNVGYSIKSYQFICDETHSTVYYQSFINSSDCNPNNMLQELSVNNTYFNCNATKPCGYVTINQYQTFQTNKNDCEHTKYYNGMAFVTDYCMVISNDDLDTGLSSSYITCNNNDYYGVMYNHTTTCDSTTGIEVQKINVTDGCNFIDIFNSTIQSWDHVECHN